MYSDLRTKVYDVVSTASGLNNRLYFAQAPQNPGATPFAVYYFINQITGRPDSNSTSELVWLQINIFSEEKTTAKTMDNVTEAIIDKLDSLKNSLSVTGYRLLDYKKDFVLPAQKAEGYWRLSIQYSILIDKII